MAKTEEPKDELKDLEQMREEMLAAVKADVEKMLSDAKAQAEQMIESAKASATDGYTDQQLKEANDYLNQIVTVELFQDGDKYKDDVFVSVNSKTYLIQRGVPVQVPRYIAMHLEECRAQELMAIRLMDDEAAKYAAKEI